MPVTISMGWNGNAIGTALSPTLEVRLIDVIRCTLTGANKQCYIAAGSAAITINPSGTTTLNLLTGLTNPLGESITGGAAFAHVFAVVIQHDPASLATAGITAFGGASGNLFQGPLGAAGQLTLLPGMGNEFLIPANLTGWVASASHKNIDLTNLDATALHVAKINVGIFGTTN